jgi:uncharacterized protein (DUF2384 family)
MNSENKKTNSGTNARRISSPAMSHSTRHQQKNQRLTIPTSHAVVVHFSSKRKKRKKSGGILNRTNKRRKRQGHKQKTYENKACRRTEVER